MITGELKNKVDRIWESFWTGGIANPIDVLSQLTYLLYMKMLDDKQLQEESNANQWGFELNNPIFGKGKWKNPKTGIEVDYEDMRWHVFKNFSSDNMFRMVRDNVFEFIKTIGEGEHSAYSKFMSNAIFYIPNEHILQSVVDGIDGLGIKDKDMMGDIYEYCMGKMETSGVNGQFRTPRHIINMMVRMMKPNLKDKICDPAMGTAGFLVESAKYIQQHYAKEMMDEELYKHYQSEEFCGFDTDQTMLRIGVMNLMLHDVTQPEVNQRDSLSTDNEDEQKYTLCLANPPFKGTVNANVLNPRLTSMVKTSKTELLFVLQFIRSLQLGGRCACIVPDGVLFGGSNAHKAVRKNLIDNQCLKAVISMPSGVFKPYAGVSTAILIFMRTDAGGTEDVWFYDMKADGFSLDDKRSPIEANDIDDIVARFENIENEKDRKRTEQSFIVPADEIRANDYDLSINKYKEVEKVKVEYEAPEVVMGRIETLQTEITAAIKEFKEKHML